MAKIITVTTSQAETAVDFGAYYQFAWVKNLSDDTDCYISDHSGASAEDDDVALVSAGSSAMIVMSGDTIYIIGSGVKCECRAQNFAECPFGDLAGESGGGSAPDTYLKTAAIGNDGSLTLTKQDNTTVSLTLDATPTQNSTHGVTSGGVYTVLQGVLPIDYSTTEQDTGRKWIDGKSIYQKTFVPTAPATSWEGTNNSIDVSGLNIDTLINTEAQAQNRNNGNLFSLNMVSEPTNTIVLDSTKSNIQVYLGNVNAPARVFNFTIWYTKTTDTAE